MLVVLEVVSQREADGAQWLSVSEPGRGQEGAKLGAEVHQRLVQQ